MRIISKKTIKDFYEQTLYQDSKESLEAWHKELIKADWQTPNDIKEQYRHASMVGNNRVVFNIYGNKYRLIVKINYFAKVVYIRFIGTHKEYDKINAVEI
ncbi:MAG: type II toxin-antitoxin system HigB family toxin [Aliarcobacter sp.]|nr:type II toxin-antitoxin system HigB family toxin [Aliarcobacter sp.]